MKEKLTISYKQLMGVVLSFEILAFPAISYIHNSGSSHLELSAIAIYIIFALISIPVGLLLSKGDTLKAFILGGLYCCFLLTSFPAGLPELFSKYNGSLTLLTVFSLGVIISLVLNKNIINITLCFFSVLILSTLFTPTKLPSLKSSQPNINENSKSDLAPLIHIILDGHSSINSLQEDAVSTNDKAKTNHIATSYLTNGFDIYTKAYSPYSFTKYSLASAFNFRTFNNFQDTLIDHTEFYSLNKNKYFDTLIKKGYKINVFQSSYIKLCNDNVKNCYTYLASALGTGYKLSFKLRLKFNLITIASLYRGKHLLKFLHKVTNIPEHLLTLPSFTALAAITQKDRMAKFLESPLPGNMYLLHVEAPHYPFILDENCQLYSNNTISISSQNIKQTTCVHKTIFSILNEVINKTPNATIIVHGDHGARSTKIYPLVKNKNILTKVEYTNHFSTLFAIRTNPSVGQFNSQAIPLHKLLINFVTPDTPNIIPNSYEHKVYLTETLVDVKRFDELYEVNYMYK